MKLLFRILKITAGILLFGFLALFSAALLYQDKVAEALLKSFSERVSTRFEFGTLKLSFLRSFPKASLELKDVIIFSSPGYNKLSFAGINTDTLLSARSVNADFSIKDIIKGRYVIDRIGIKEGRLNLCSDSSGKVNYDIYLQTGKPEGGSFLIDLERIAVSEVRASYRNLATGIFVGGIVENARIKSRITDSGLDFSSDGKLIISGFSLYDFSLSGPVPSEININLSSSQKGVFFRKSSLILDGFLFGITGVVASDNYVDLSLTGDGIEISTLRKYFPEKLRNRLSEYNPAGRLNIRAGINGIISRVKNPGFDIGFNLSNGTINHISTPLTVKNLSIDGTFSGKGTGPASASLNLPSVSFILGSSEYSGSLHLTRFDSLNAEVTLKGTVVPSEIKEFFGIREISSADGSFDIDLKMAGHFTDTGKISLPAILNMNPSARIHFNSFSLGLRNNKFLIGNVSGLLNFSDTTDIENLNFNLRNHTFGLSGTLIGLPDWLSGKPVVLSFTGNGNCNLLEPEILFPSLRDTSRRNDGVHMPDDILLDLEFNIGNFRFRDVIAESIKGKLNYRPGIADFTSIGISALDGKISGDGFLLQNRSGDFIAKVNLLLEEIDVNRAFISFRNFGQDFIKAENLSGDLSGKISALVPMDSMMNPIIKSITAEGRYEITGGALLNFEPVMKLSSFIDISELKGIKFEKLENDFFIRNNYLFIPQMDVRSSAADLQVNGKHGFDNKYEYHVKILLSEILSKKVKKPKPNTSEFGAIQDDGLGRTSMLLKIEDKGNDVKVSYDIKAAAGQVKNEIRSERQNLKTILNQEYGWFKKDSTIKKSEEPAPRKFRISWEEAGTGDAGTEVVPEKEEKGIKSIFKR